MTKNELFLGVLAGMIGNIPKDIMAWILYGLNITPYTFAHFCAGIFVPPVYIRHWASIAVGFFADFVMAASFGFLLALILKKYGTDYWMIKGLGFGGGLFVYCFGMLRPMVSPLRLSDPVANLLFVLPHLFFGLTASCIVAKRLG